MRTRPVRTRRRRRCARRQGQPRARAPRLPVRGRLPVRPARRRPYVPPRHQCINFRTNGQLTGARRARSRRGKFCRRTRSCGSIISGPPTPRDPGPQPYSFAVSAEAFNTYLSAGHLPPAARASSRPYKLADDSTRMGRPDRRRVHAADNVAARGWRRGGHRRPRATSGPSHAVDPSHPNRPTLPQPPRRPVPPNRSDPPSPPATPSPAPNRPIRPSKSASRIDPGAPPSARGLRFCFGWERRARHLRAESTDVIAGPRLCHGRGVQRVCDCARPRSLVRGGRRRPRGTHEPRPRKPPRRGTHRPALVRGQFAAATWAPSACRPRSPPLLCTHLS